MGTMPTSVMLPSVGMQLFGMDTLLISMGTLQSNLSTLLFDSDRLHTAQKNSTETTQGCCTSAHLPKHNFLVLNSKARGSQAIALYTAEKKGTLGACTRKPLWVRGRFTMQALCDSSSHLLRCVQAAQCCCRYNDCATPGLIGRQVGSYGSSAVFIVWGRHKGAERL